MNSTTNGVAGDLYISIGLPICSIFPWLVIIISSATSTASEVNDYSKLKGFDEIQGAKRAIIRPEFVKLSKYGKLQQYNSAAEEGYVEDILFRGNHLDVTVNIGGTMITGEWSLEKEPLQVGEKVHVLIYRIYAVDDEKTYLCENKGMRDDDVFYI